MRATNRFHWLAIAPMAVVLALASQLALAHGGHHHELQAAAPAANDGQPVVAAERIGPSPVEAAWSGSCPDGSGGDCCCKHQPVTPGTAKAALVDSGGWTRPALLPRSRPADRLTETLPQQAAVFRALPRAPPFFS